MRRYRPECARTVLRACGGAVGAWATEGAAAVSAPCDHVSTTPRRECPIKRSVHRRQRRQDRAAHCHTWLEPGIVCGACWHCRVCGGTHLRYPLDVHLWRDAPRHRPARCPRVRGMGGSRGAPPGSAPHPRQPAGAAVRGIPPSSRSGHDTGADLLRVRVVRVAALVQCASSSCSCEERTTSLTVVGHVRQERSARQTAGPMVAADWTGVIPRGFPRRDQPALVVSPVRF